MRWWWWWWHHHYHRYQYHHHTPHEHAAQPWSLVTYQTTNTGRIAQITLRSASQIFSIPHINTKSSLGQ
jgi:hypothetical protein